MSAPQSLKNHSRMDPAFHYVILPILLVNLIAAIRTTIHDWPAHPQLNLWWIVMSITLILMAGRSRAYALKAQDRVIRLEERLRLSTLLPATEHARIVELTPAQLIALRFAADEEVVALALRASSQNLQPKAIKQSIVAWRPDHHRV
jgi:hypothetical protein